MQFEISFRYSSIAFAKILTRSVDWFPGNCRPPPGKRTGINAQRAYVVCLKSIANFEFPRVMYIRFSIFCGVMLVLISLTYADKLGHFECSVNC